MSFMSNARSTNSSKVLYFAHRKATSKPEKPSRNKENGAILYFAHEEGKSGYDGGHESHFLQLAGQHIIR